MEGDFDDSSYGIIAFAGSVLSGVGSFVVVIAIPTLWRHTPPGRHILYDRIVLSLGVVDLILSIIQIVITFTYSEEDDVLCQVAATCRNMFQLLQVFLMTLFGLELAYNVGCSVKRLERGSPFYRCRWALGGIMVIVALAVSIVPDFNTSFARYEHLDAWCWIGPNYPLARQLLFYCFLYLCLIADIISYIFIIYRTIATHLDINRYISSTIDLSKILKLSLFPLIFTIAWIPAIFYRLYEIFYPEAQIAILDYFMSGVIPLSGFFNFVLYGVTRNILSKAFVMQSERVTTSDSVNINN